MGRPAIFVSILVLAACSSAGTPTTTTTEAVDNWFIYEGPPSTVAVELSGVLSIDVETHCVRVGDTQALFPEGTSLDVADPERPGVVFPSGHSFYSGDMVRFGGGGNRSPIAGPAENCGTDQNFAVGGGA